jgi:hypothetical protein
MLSGRTSRPVFLVRTALEDVGTSFAFRHFGCLVEGVNITFLPEAAGPGQYSGQ